MRSRVNELFTRRPARRRLSSIAALMALVASLSLALAPAAAASFVAPAATARSGGGTGTHVGSNATSHSPSYIRLSLPTSSVLGKDVTVVAVLRNGSGTPLAGQHLSLFLDNAQVRSDRTDARGTISFVIPAKKMTQARAYPIAVTYGGAHLYAASVARASITILAAAIQIQTVPPLSGLRFNLGSETALSGADGLAALPVPTFGSYQLTVDLNADTSATATIKASFVRWLDNVYSANRTIDVTGPATYTIGLRVAYRASIKYVDLENDPVDPSLVSQAQFSTGTGTDDVVLNSQIDAGSVWWTASSTVRSGTTLQPSAVTYRVISIKIHGAEVVNRGQQAWTPTQGGVWTVQVLLYPMTVQTRDAVFGMPVSGQLKLTYPDGVSITQPVDSTGRASFTDLPRGQYELSLHPAAVSPPTPVALSKPQDATLRVITYLDVAFGAGILILAILVLFMIGRGSILLRRRRRQPVAESQPAADRQPAVDRQPAS
jgi:hypothetical protein